MSTYNLLELSLGDILRVIEPSKRNRSVRRRLIKELQAVVESVESLRGSTVEPYGSFVSNLFTKWGDLDISIELINDSCISSAGIEDKQDALKEVLKALRKQLGWCNFELIAHARVPILKLERRSISIDISINNLIGQMKSKILLWINKIDGRFRDMILVVKEWAKSNHINDSKSGTFNSYCLSLLVIFHFQTCSPAILPPLKEIYPGNMVNDLTGVRADAEKHIEETCATNINRFKSDRSRLINRSSLSDLFISFIEKFLDLRSKASEQGISLYFGRWEYYESNSAWRRFALFVEDPFDRPANCARTVSFNELQNVEAAFEKTHSLLISRTQDWNHLVANLVMGETFGYLVRTGPALRPAGNLGGDPEIRPQPAPRPTGNPRGDHGTQPRPAGNPRGNNGTPTRPAGTAEGNSGTPPRPAGTAEGNSGTPTRPAGTAEGNSGTPPRPARKPRGRRRGTRPRPTGNPEGNSGTPPQPAGKPRGRGHGTRPRPTGNPEGNSGAPPRPAGKPRGRGRGTQPRPTGNPEGNSGTPPRPAGNPGGNRGTPPPS